MTLLRVEVPGADVRTVADALALRLSDAGTVFAPVAPVRPEARMEAVAPQALAVDVAGDDAAERLLEWAAQVLGAGPVTEVTFSRDERQLTVDQRALAEARNDLQSLLGSGRVADGREGDA